MPDARRSVSFPRHGGSRNTKDLPGRTQLTRSLAATRGHDPSSTRGGHLRQRTNPVLIPLSRKSASGTTAPRVFKAILLAAATSVAPFNLPLRPGADERPARAAKMRVRPAAFARESVCHPLPPPGCRGGHPLGAAVLALAGSPRPLGCAIHLAPRRPWGRHALRN